MTGFQKPRVRLCVLHGKPYAVCGCSRPWGMRRGRPVKRPEAVAREDQGTVSGMTLSRWCANPDGEEAVLYEQSPEGGSFTETVIRVSGHDLCRSERWHDRSHVDCCAGVDEKESWACGCDCHAGSTGRRMT